VEFEESTGAHLESEFLELNSDLASNRLGWMPQINQISAIEATVNWWKEYFRDESSARELVKKEISDYVETVLKS
jgi:CDP-glucose 4,6-dehydratase